MEHSIFKIDSRSGHCVWWYARTPSRHCTTNILRLCSRTWSRKIKTSLSLSLSSASSSYSYSCTFCVVSLWHSLYLWQRKTKMLYLFKSIFCCEARNWTIRFNVFINARKSSSWIKQKKISVISFLLLLPLLPQVTVVVSRCCCCCRRFVLVDYVRVCFVILSMYCTICLLFFLILLFFLLILENFAVYPNTHLDDVDSDLFVLKYEKMYKYFFLSLVLFVTAISVLSVVCVLYLLLVFSLSLSLFFCILILSFSKMYNSRKIWLLAMSLRDTDTNTDKF